MLSAMAACGLAKEEIGHLLDIVAFIIQLGQVRGGMPLFSSVPSWPHIGCLPAQFRGRLLRSGLGGWY